MKRHLTMILLVGILLATLEMGHAQDIFISTFDYKSPNLDVAERVMTEAYKRVGQTMHIRRLPGERAIRTANYGEVDGELIRRDKMSQAYPNLIIVPVTIITIDFVVFTKEKRFPVKSWESLIPYRVGHRHGVKTVETNLVKGTKSQPVATLEQAFRQLDIGRNDVVVDTLFGGLVKLNQLGMKNIVVLNPPLIASPQYHYLHIKNKKLLAPLTAVLRKMEEKGVIRQIQQRVIQDLSSLQERENSKLETSAISFMGSG